MVDTRSRVPIARECEEETVLTWSSVWHIVHFRAAKGTHAVSLTRVQVIRWVHVPSKDVRVWENYPLTISSTTAVVVLDAGTFTFSGCGRNKEALLSLRIRQRPVDAQTAGICQTGRLTLDQGRSRIRHSTVDECVLV